MPIEDIETFLPATVRIGLVLPHAVPLSNDNAIQAIEASGWLLCDGRPVRYDDYPLLGKLLKCVYDDHPVLGPPPDGHFRVPDLRGRTPIGAESAGVAPTPPSRLTLREAGRYIGTETVTLSELQIPSHTHHYDRPTTGGEEYDTGQSGRGDAARRTREETEPSGGGHPHDNIQPSLTVNFIILAR